jgi:eukaryotic-like serine/threonine-protein kinase
MTPELYQRLKALYDAALDIPKEKRAAFVAEACGDDRELRVELEALLKANDEATATLGAPFIRFEELFAGPERAFADGQLIQGRFEIVRHLGTGGMGEVYEAIDHQLGRIALKTIRPGVTANREQLSRFKKEVQLARRVSSRHVCRIHELFLPEGPAYGPQIAFLTMEFLEGITLTDKVRKDGPLPWREARTLALEICAGLQCIHEEEIIHRDLKGRNIMLAYRKGTTCAVLMDFGIAHELSHHTGNTSTTLTRDGAIIGTPGYIAPEQFEGKEATPATDVYALGIVLYECVTGQRPFSEEPQAEGTLGRAKHPTRISSIRPGVPRRFDEVVCRCLEYDPKRRFQSAKAVERALRDTSFFPWLKQRPLAMTTAALSLMLVVFSVLLIPAVGERIRGILFSSPEKHIAVLPFEIVGGAHETQALGDGLMDSLAGRLSNLDAANKTLWVVPANEVRSRKVNDPRSALREFGATIVVKGSFERNEQAARLKLTLIDPKRTREIGFVDVEDHAGDLAALQDEAVTRLGRLMNISVGEQHASASEESVVHAVYEDYLLALGYIQRYDKPGNLDLAINALQRATETDQHFALGFARLAQVYVLKYRLDLNPRWLQEAQQYCKRALQLDSRVPLTYVTLARIHELTGNHDLAVQEFRHALDLDPRNAETLTGVARSYQNAGDNAEAEAAYIKAAELRPDDWNGYNNLGNFYDDNGRHLEAIAQFRHALQLTPDNSALYANLGSALLNSGDPKLLAESEKALKQSIAINPTYQAYANLGNLYGVQHRFNDCIHATRQALQINDQDYEVWGNLVEAYEWVGDRENANIATSRAIELLERAVKQNPQDAEAEAMLAAMLARRGTRAEAMSKIKTSLALAPDSQYVLCEVADAYERLGDRKRAIVYLQRALQRGFPPGQLNGDFDLVGVIADPGFQRLHK